MQNTKEAPDPVDIHVGGRVRARRKILGFSQRMLADYLGVTFQQVQKYERGTNRISASKLMRMAVFLEVPVEYFFEKLEPDVFIDNIPTERRQAETDELLDVYLAIRSPYKRNTFKKIIELLAE